MSAAAFAQFIVFGAWVSLMLWCGSVFTGTVVLFLLIAGLYLFGLIVRHPFLFILSLIGFGWLWGGNE
ncbi:MAG: hypothetical protein AB1479_08380 [Pseudomonadota bacterium]